LADELVFLLPASDSDELLTAVDVEGPASEGRVDHEVDRECGEFSRPDAASVWQRGRELLPPRVQLIAEEGRRQWCVDKSGGDQVHPDWREFGGQVFCNGGKCSCERRDEVEARRRATAAGAAHEKECPSRPD